MFQNGKMLSAVDQMMGCASVIIAHYGTEVLAGYQIGLRVEGLVLMPGIGFTTAAMKPMRQGLGAKNPQQAREDVILVLKYTSGFMFFLSFFMIFIPEKIVWLFTDDTQTIAEASLYLRIVSFLVKSANLKCLYWMGFSD